jgi:hypothetical protein
MLGSSERHQQRNRISERQPFNTKPDGETMLIELVVLGSATISTATKARDGRAFGALHLSAVRLAPSSAASSATRPGAPRATPRTLFRIARKAWPAPPSHAIQLSSQFLRAARWDMPVASALQPSSARSRRHDG